MKLQYIIIALLVLSLLTTGYVWLSTNRQLAEIRMVLQGHDQVLLHTICVTRVSGVIDLNQCPPIPGVPSPTM